MTLPKIDWTKVGLAVLLILSSWFGVQQCRSKAEALGDAQAAHTAMSYWMDKSGTEHAKVGQLVTSQAAARKELDSLHLIKGAKVTASTTIAQYGKEVLLPARFESDSGRWVRAAPNLWMWEDTIHTTGTRRQDTVEYVLTARDSLDWLLHSHKTYASAWDTVHASLDSVVLIINDRLHVVESQVKEGGLFNRHTVPYVDVYHENPMLRTSDIKAWRVSTPTKHWGIGPSVNMYPKIDGGIKFGYSFGLSLTYTAITF